MSVAVTPTRIYTVAQGRVVLDGPYQKVSLRCDSGANTATVRAKVAALTRDFPVYR